MIHLRLSRLPVTLAVAGLLAAVAFVLAFMAAGAVIASSLFMVLGMAALAWLAWSLIKRVGRHHRTSGPTSRA